MQTQITITTEQFNAAVQTFPQPDGAPLVDARGLHGFLGVRDSFHQWIGRRIAEYGFEEASDFCTEMCKTGGRPRRDYHLTLDMAKELAMVERSDIGRATRRYFIAMEKAAVEMAETLHAEGRAEDIPVAYFDAQTLKAELRDEFSARLAELEARLPKRPALTNDWLTARAVAEFMGILDPRIPASGQAAVASRIGVELTGYCLLNGHKVQKTGYAAQKKKNLYPKAGVEAWLARQTVQ